MNNHNDHNDHNENTPNTPQSDASKLSDEQQILLTAEALGQLETGSNDARKAAEIRAGHHGNEAEQITADTSRVAEALRTGAAQETATLTDDPARKALRQAVLTAIAQQGSVTPTPDTVAGQKNKMKT